MLNPMGVLGKLKNACLYLSSGEKFIRNDSLTSDDCKTENICKKVICRASNEKLSHIKIIQDRDLKFCQSNFK